MPGHLERWGLQEPPTLKEQPPPGPGGCSRGLPSWLCVFQEDPWEVQLQKALRPRFQLNFLAPLKASTASFQASYFMCIF